MKAVFALVAIAAMLAGSTVPVRSLPLAAETRNGPWKRQEPEKPFWKCSHTVTGCTIKFCCQAQPELEHDTLDCHLDGRDFACESTALSELPDNADLCFSIDANLATVNDGSPHRMVISVRGEKDDRYYSLPWHFNFRVDLLYCSARPTIIPTTEAPVTTAETPVTTEGTTMTTPTVVTVTSSTTMTPTTRPTTQPTTQPPTTRPTTQPTTQPPTTRPTTQPPTTRPTTQPTTQPPTTRPTTQPTTQPPTTRPTTQPPICNAGRNSDRNLVILCTSEVTIANITCEVNEEVVPCEYDGGMVTIADGIFADGLNVIELIVTYDNGQSHIVVMTYEIERQNSTPAPASAFVECTARFSLLAGMEVTCVINNDFTGNGITSIRYNVNDQGEEEATSIPTFVIGVEKFSNGRNRIVIDITHSQHGTASISMDIPNLNIPVTPPPPPCRVSCSYRGVLGALEFVCSIIEGDGSISSVEYSLNGFSTSDLQATFQIPNSHLVNGNNDITLTFNIVCNGQNEVLEHRFSLSLNLPPPPAFSISNVRVSSSSGLRQADVEISYSRAQDIVTFTVIVLDQAATLYGYTLNGGTETHVVGPSFSLHKDVLVEGANTLELSVYYGVNVSQADFTFTFDIQK